MANREEFEAVEQSKRIDLSSESKDQYRSYEVPLFVTQHQVAAEFLFARGFTLIGVEPVQLSPGGSAWNFKFAQRRTNNGLEPAKSAAAFESGKAPPVSEKALEHAKEQIRATIRGFEHQQILASTSVE